MTQRWLGAPVTATQELLERVAEIFRTQTIDERICCRVAVAEPEENIEEDDRSTVTTECFGKIDSEEWSPTDHEATDNNADCFSGFLLLVKTA